MDSLICEDNIWKNDVEVCDIEEFGEEETTSNSNYLMERHGHDSLAVKDASRPSSELKYETETLECTNSINERFIHILRQVSIAEHIRIVQSFYKDPEDDLTLVVSHIFPCTCNVSLFLSFPLSLLLCFFASLPLCFFASLLLCFFASLFHSSL